MKRGLVALFAFLIWFIGTNHCALEAAAQLPCACGESQSTSSGSSKSCNGSPCLTVTLSSSSSIQVASLAQPNLNLHLISFIWGQFYNGDVKPNRIALTTQSFNFSSHSELQIRSLVAASNAPPVLSNI